MTDRARGLLAAFFLVCFGSAAWSHAVHTSATFDEPPHLAAGYVYGSFADYRLNPEHPPLFKRLAALPWRWSGRWPHGLELDRPPTADNPGRLAWTEARRAFALAAGEVDAQWLFAHTLLYGARDATLERLGVRQTYAIDGSVELTPEDYLNDVGVLLLGARSVTIVAGLLLVSLIGLWAYRLHGADGALLALALACFDPNLIAHGSLVTTDIPFTALLVATVYWLWRAGADPRREELSLRFLGLGLLAFGLSLATKFSAVVLLPVLPLLAIAALAHRDPSWRCGRWKGRLGTWRHKLSALLLFALAAALVGGVAIWASYGWRYEAASDAVSDVGVRLPVELTLRRAKALELLAGDHPNGPPPDLVEATAAQVELGLPARLLVRLDSMRAVPEAFAFGIAEAQRKAQSRTSFLRGEISSRGFPTYFLWTFLLKTPIVSLLLCTLALLLLARRRMRAVDLLFLLLPLVIYALFSFSSRLNIGHRHLVPLYPFLYVLSGSLITTSRARRVTPFVLGWVVLGSSLVWTPAVRPQVIYPDYLAYFNELAGGPAQGSKSLVDSNLDWGQDLPALATWLEENGVEEPIALCYFGTADPRYHGIRFVNLPGGYPFAPPFGRGSFAALDQPGYLAISATHVRGVYFDPVLRASWRQRLMGAEPIAMAGRSIDIYRLEP